MKVTSLSALFFAAVASTLSSFASAKLYPTSEIFELVLFGDGYDETMENDAWNTVTSIFENCYGSGFQVLEDGGKRLRLLRGTEAEEQQEQEENEEQRELLRTCPNSCRGSTSRRCRYLCGSGGGRRVLQKGQVSFNKSRCEAEMNSALNKNYLQKNPSLKMKAVINV